MMLSRSRVERARRSRRVTTSTSPDSSRRITLASSGLSVFAPEAFSLKMLPQPAACSSAIWPARSWSRVDTRAYPKVAISLSSFESDFRINKASKNSGQENYSQLVSFESSRQLFAERQDGAGPRHPIVAATPGGQDAAISRTELWIVRAGLLLSPGRAPIGGSVQLSYRARKRRS